MNIFVLGYNSNGFPCPIQSAQSQIDKHVVKMPLETAQILSTIARNQGYSDHIYKSTHRNHPCTLWAGASTANFLWTVEHGKALCSEYTDRYGKIHASQKIIEIIGQLDLTFEHEFLTLFAQAMPDQYRSIDVVEAYRRYYLAEKRAIATWKRNKPDWWLESL